MTACVNKKSKRVAAVVTASLVGALSIGAPAVALATGSDISMQSVGALGGGTLTAAEDGQYGDVKDLKGTIKFEAGSGKFLVPTVVTDVAGNELDVTDSDAYTIKYERTVGGATGNVDPGEGNTFADFFADPANTVKGMVYKVIITNKQDSKDTKEISFKYVDSTEAKKLTAVEDKDADDTTFTYNGMPQNVTFVDQNGDEFKTAGWTVKYYNANGTPVDGGGSTAPASAGSYTAVVSKGDVSYTVPFTVEKLDLSKAAIFIEDATTTPYENEAAVEAKMAISGVENAQVAGIAKITGVKNPLGGSAFSAGVGKYELTFGATNGSNDPNVTGTATVSYWTLDDTVDGYSARYGSADSGSINLSDDESFDASKINLYNTTYVRRNQGRQARDHLFQGR